ncbi:MAG: decaprenyl-phosphate phosphoribosyltransferase [candidate division Zixibacteria bacterium]|nr:decaprenyl-phosphate phosphoribosyltransferase [candidate division Zixibacteria bacterium]
MLSAIFKSLRPLQWIKNFVLFAALVFAGEVLNLDKALLSVIGFIIFCLLSSSIYVINDLIDKSKDKLHPLKKDRPIASGEISSTTALTISILLLVISLSLSFYISLNFFIISLSFIILNLLYTFILKNVVIIDVLTIALSFVIRAHAGAVIISVPTSKWMLINTLLLALFLGFGKRRHELIFLKHTASEHRKSLGKYSPYLLDQLIGVVTGAVVVMYMLYSFSPEVSQKLGTENLFLTIPFVIYGIFRYLYLIHREEEGGSPSNILISDRPILLTVLFWILTVIITLYLL